MKQLIYICVMLSLAACSKPEADFETDSQEPVDVYYKVRGSSDAPKHVSCYLWNSNQQRETLELVGRIDTVIRAEEAVLSITQNRSPYIYAKVSFEVSVLEGYEQLGIEVAYGNRDRSRLLLSQYGSCPEQSKSFSNEYVRLYKPGQQEVK